MKVFFRKITFTFIFLLPFFRAYSMNNNNIITNDQSYSNGIKFSKLILNNIDSFWKNTRGMLWSNHYLEIKENKKIEENKILKNFYYYTEFKVANQIPKLEEILNVPNEKYENNLKKNISELKNYILLFNFLAEIKDNQNNSKEILSEKETNKFLFLQQFYRKVQKCLKEDPSKNKLDKMKFLGIKRENYLKK